MSAILYQNQRSQTKGHLSRVFVYNEFRIKMNSDSKVDTPLCGER